MPKTDAILLASGFSTRFGAGNKLLWPYKGRPLAVHTLRLACGLGLNQVFFVTASAEVAALAKGWEVTQLHNATPQRGMRESIRLGVKASDADYYLFFTCDAPLLDEATVRAVLAKARPGCIAYPEHNGKPGHPTLFSATFREELLGLGEGQHARDIKNSHPDACIPVAIPSSLPLQDIDTLADADSLAEK